MADVPTVDYDAQASMLVELEAKVQLPPAIRAVYDKPALRSFLETRFVAMPGFLQNIHVRNVSFEMTPELKAKLEDLAALSDAQAVKHTELRKKLTAIIEGCSTVKKALELLPEFAKYLPSESSGARDLPMVSNVVAELTQAGWPKESGVPA